MNELGELTWSGMTSLWHLIVLALATCLGGGQHWIRAARAKLVLAKEVAELAAAHRTKETFEKEILRG